MLNPNKCVNCHATLKDGAKFCSKCGAPAPKVEENRCENLSCERCTSNFLFGPDDLYCDRCGTATTLGQKINDML